MSAIEPYDYAGHSLVEKYVWVTGQPGMRAVEAAADSVRTMGGRLDAITTAAGQDMRNLGMSWAGPASDAAQHSARQIVDRAAQTRSLADNGADRILDYGRSFDEMRKKIAFENPAQLSWVEQVLEPTKYAWDAVAGDHVSLLKRNQDHDAVANDALRWHETNARAADDGFLTAGTDPPPAPGAGAGSGGTGGRDGGGGDLSASAPPPVAAAATAPAAPAAPPSVATPSSGPPAVPAATGGSGPAGGPAVALPTPGAPGAGTVRPGAGGGAGGTGAGRDAAQRPGPAGGPTGTGSTAPAGVPDAAQQRRRLADEFRDGLARSSPYGGGRTPGTTPGPGMLPDGTGGRATPGVGSGPGGRWPSRTPDGRTPLPGEGGARTGAGGWRDGSVGGFGGGRYGGTGEPTSRLPGDPASRLPGEPGARSWSRGSGEPLAGRPVAGEPVVSGRTGSGPGYAPMMGGAGGGRDDGDPHRNRYLLPSSEPFDVDVPHSPPVLAPDEDG